MSIKQFKEGDEVWLWQDRGEQPQEGAVIGIYAPPSDYQVDLGHSACRFGPFDLYHRPDKDGVLFDDMLQNIVDCDDAVIKAKSIVKEFKKENE